MGDDRTDEDLFERLGPDAVTIKVGPGPTRARYRVAGPKAALALLGELAVSPSGSRRAAPVGARSG